MDRRFTTFLQPDRRCIAGNTVPRGVWNLYARAFLKHRERTLPPELRSSRRRNHAHATPDRDPPDETEDCSCCRRAAATEVGVHRGHGGEPRAAGKRHRHMPPDPGLVLAHECHGEPRGLPAEDGRRAQQPGVAEEHPRRPIDRRGRRGEDVEGAECGQVLGRRHVVRQDVDERHDRRGELEEPQSTSTPSSERCSFPS